MMDFISLATFLALAGSPAPAKTEATATCCTSQKAEAAVKVVKSEGYVCPLTGQVLPCPSCCPGNAKTATK